MYYRATVEHIINTYPSSYLVLLALGEIFDSLKESNYRIHRYILAKSFNIIRYRENIKALFSYRFKYIFYSSKMQNHYKLENHIKKDLEEKIINKY